MVSLPLEPTLQALQGAAPRAASRVSAVMAGLRISACCDDAAFFPTFRDMFGDERLPPGATLPSSDLHLDVHAGDEHAEFGWFRMCGSNALPIDAHEFSFALQTDRGLFDLLAVEEAGWTCLAFRGTKTPALAFRGRDCLFSRASPWRDSILWYLFWRVLRIRQDAIFFHASSLGIDGQGTMFVGPSGSGKSTTSLALAARGHNFLSDEIAGWLPSTGELIPFRRPVGIKPGPRASAVQNGLAADIDERIGREGFARVDIDSLFPVAAAANVPLKRVVFLRGFRAQPSLQRIAPGIPEIAELQPLMSSFLNASHARRVFDLARMLGGARVYQLHPGEPDATATHLEEAFASE